MTREKHRPGLEEVIPMRPRRLAALVAAAGTSMFMALSMAATASAAPRAPTAPASGGTVPSVVEHTSGAFSNNQDVLGPGVVPGSVYVVATQGPAGSNNPPVDTFGPGTGYTVSSDFSTVTLQAPYAGSNDGFVTHYATFVNPNNATLTTGTSGAFSNNQDVILAQHIVPGSVYVVATLGQVPGGNNPSVNGFARDNGYTVAYNTSGAIATLQAPFAGSNDGFVTYYTTYALPVMRHPSVLTARFLYGPRQHRHWVVSNVAGGRDRSFSYLTWKYSLHAWVWEGRGFVSAKGTAVIITHHGGGTLKINYWNGYGVLVHAYAHH